MRLGKKLAAAILGLGLAVTSAQAAPLTNGGFETNTGSAFTGWTNIGANVTATDSNYLSIIPQGNASGAFSNGSSPIYSALGGSTTNLSAANSALGITAFSNLATNNANDVSGVYQTFDIATPSTISFSYAFATNEGPNADFGFFSLGGTNLNILATASAATTNLSSGPTSLDLIASDFATWTGWQTFTTGVLAPGTYTIGFGASNVPSGTGVNSSALLVDNVTVSVVPIPSAVWAGLALFGGLGAMQIARRKAAVAVA